MNRVSLPFLRRLLSLALFLTGLCLLCPLSGHAAGEQPTRPTRPAGSAPATPSFRFGDDQGKRSVPSSPGSYAPPQTSYASGGPVYLGIDVLEQQGFAAVKGKRIGLLTHPAGVNRRGERTVDVLRRAPGVRLAVLFGPEHGINGDAPAEITVPNSTDRRTGLPVYSLYGAFRKPTPKMLAGLDALVIDLQDIGTRSYTYVSAMRLAMEACFENNVEVIVLDRPNPLGGIKVDGPTLDRQWTSYVGSFRVPYVHGLTIGELARMAKSAPGVLDVSASVRERGKLTVIPMRGWKRSMLWTDTGLRWIPTSPNIPDFAAVLGYPMTGLGCILGGFSHGTGDSNPFRGIAHRSVKSEQLEKDLNACRIPGIRLQRVAITTPDGRSGKGLFIQIADFDSWRPTELSFYLMKLACKYDSRNPFASASSNSVSLFMKHMGSSAFMEALKRDGARVDVEAFVRDCQNHARVYQQQARKYWLYY